MKHLYDHKGLDKVQVRVERPITVHQVDNVIVDVLIRSGVSYGKARVSSLMGFGRINSSNYALASNYSLPPPAGSGWGRGFLGGHLGAVGSASGLVHRV